MLLVIYAFLGNSLSIDFTIELYFDIFVLFFPDFFLLVFLKHYVIFINGNMYTWITKIICELTIKSNRSTFSAAFWVLWCVSFKYPSLSMQSNKYPFFKFNGLHQSGNRVVILANCGILISYSSSSVEFLLLEI